MVDALFETPPTSKWQVLLPQIVAYSYKQFCVSRLEEDLSGEKKPLWNTQIELIYEYAPSTFKPFLDDWWKPELVEQVPLLEEMDKVFRDISSKFDMSIEIDDYEKQLELAELLDEDLYIYFLNWIPEEFKEYFFFPEGVDIDEEKLIKILELFRTPEKRRMVARKTRRTNPKRTLTPIRNSLSNLRKTRRRKQNEILQVSAGSANHGT
jgi:hypothetical protein